MCLRAIKEGDLIRKLSLDIGRVRVSCNDINEIATDGKRLPSKMNCEARGYVTNSFPTYRMI